jgi:hypothetical protein
MKVPLPPLKGGMSADTNRGENTKKGGKRGKMKENEEKKE